MATRRDIELAAASWLRFERRCLLVMFERAEGGVYSFSRPDVIAVTKERHYIEVEIKRTLSDFRANAEKHHVKHRPMFIDQWPRLFYFAVPEKLYASVLPECPAYAGLLVLAGHEVKVAKRGVVNKAAKPLTIRKLASLVAQQSNNIIAETQRVERLKDTLRNRNGDTWEADYVI